MTLTHGGLFEGMGATSMAAGDALGFDLDTRWVSDIKPSSVAFLNRRFPDTRNIGDIKAYEFSSDDYVDVMTASWPCQPHSAAGKRLGEADPRALWPDVIRAVRDVRPLIFMGENVARIATNGELLRVIRSFAEAGYVGAWRCITAASVGAPHRRDRCFLVAVDAAALSDAEGKRRAERIARAAGIEWGSDAPVCGDSAAPDPDSDGVRIEPGRDDAGREGAPDVPEVAGSDGEGGRLRAEPHAARIARRLLPTPAAHPRRSYLPSVEVGQRRLDQGRRNLEDAVSAHLRPDDVRLDYVPTRADRGLEPHPPEDEGALLPTPIARDYKGSDANRVNDYGRPLSETVMRLLPTPEEKLWKSGPDYARMNRDGSGGDDLTTAVVRQELNRPRVELLPTPIAGDAKSARNNTQNDGAGSKRGNPGWTLSDVVYADRWGPYGAAIARWEAITGRPAPEPTQPSSRKPYGPQLSPWFVEWMMGLPEGWVCDAGQLSPKGLAPAERNARLSLLGDGVCPPQAEAAFRDLLGHALMAAA